MLNLIPTENWEFNLGDVISGFLSVAKKNNAHSLLYIDGIGDLIPSRSARAAIYSAIKVLNLQAGTRIGVPLYCCPVVFKAIQEAGCRHCFIDIDLKTYCMSAEDLDKKRNSFDAVIAVHMFGNTCDMPALIDVASGKPIIEDCAQSLGSKINGNMTGTFGVISAFSFRSGKYLTVGEGGALFSKDPIIKNKLSETISALPEPGTYDELIHLSKTYIRTKLRSRPLYGLLGYRLWQLYNKTVDYSSKSPIVLSQSYISDLSIVLKRLKRLNKMIEKQRMNADFLTRKLKLEQDMLCMEETGCFYNRYLYPIMLKTKEMRDMMSEYLNRKGIGAIKPYHDIAAVAAKHYGYKEGCPNSEKVADRVLVLPSHYKLNESNIRHIAHCLNSFCSSTN